MVKLQYKLKGNKTEYILKLSMLKSSVPCNL